MRTKQGDEVVVVNARPMDARFRNPWPRHFEDQFQSRAKQILSSQKQLGFRGTTYFESEKRWYGIAMANVLAGDTEQALAALQVRDHQHEEWHRETAGIDYYACFTLKHQMRKYFYFGELLDGNYKQVMFEGAKKWTERDPLRRPHYAYRNDETGWGPNAKNSWVDVRSTDNLFLMRVTSVYLMAEETGNEQTAAKYKQLILDYVATLYRVGLGEWDSENYLGHSIAPVYNLYDFARDDEVRLAAKAILDWFHAAGAVKYLRGAFNGPTKRDYNHAQPFGGSAASMLWIHFGDSHITPKEWESDEVHAITSAYRPPAAVVELGRGKHPKPVELLASKPPYSATTSCNRDARPQYLETQFIGETFKMGSLLSGTDANGGDTNGFKIVAVDDERGAITLQAAPTDNPAFPGSPAYQPTIVTASNQVAQFENVAVWLAKGEATPWLWVIPEHIDVSNMDEASLLTCSKTWVAILPINTEPFVVNPQMTKRVALANGKRKAKFPRHHVLSSRGDGGFSGFAVIVGDNSTHLNYTAFRDAISQAKLNLDRANEGNVELRVGSKTLAFEWSDKPTDSVVLRNGVRHDWSRHAEYLYTSTELNPSPIAATWGAGHLRVETNNYSFECAVTDEGKVTFSNGSR